MDKDTQCGIGSCKGPKLQNLASLMTITIVFSIVATITSTLGSLLSSQITSLEKQYNMSSTVSGVLLTGADIGYLTAVLFITHFARNANIPKVLGSMGLLFGLSAIATGLTSFINPLQIPTDNETDDGGDKYLCNRNSSSTSAEGINALEGRSTWVPFLILTFMIIYGISRAPRVPLITVYLDNNIQNKSKSPMYIGAVYSTIVFGPSVGLLIGSAFSKMPVDLKDTSMDSTDPRWVGAWWIGFLLLGCLGILVALPVYCIPQRLPGIKRNVTSAKKTLCEQAKDLPLSLYRVLKRPVYALCLINSTIHGFALSGINSFSPKYIEHQFNFPAWKTSLFLGVASVLTSVVGTFVGGIMTGKLNLSRQGCIKLIIITHIISLLLNAALLLLGCSNTPIEGYDYFRNDTDASLACNCGQTQFLPVCGSDHMTYASPCQAGCWNTTGNVYGDCSRVEGTTVTPGICDSGCEYFYPYLVFAALSSLTNQLSTMPLVMVYIRSVEDQDKSMAMAIYDFTSSLLGWLPAPIVYGKVIDSACKILLDTSSNSFGACALYDLEALRFRTYGLEVSLKTIALVFLFLCLLACRWEDRTMGLKEKEMAELENNVEH